MDFFLLLGCVLWNSAQLHFAVDVRIHFRKLFSLKKKKSVKPRDNGAYVDSDSLRKAKPKSEAKKFFKSRSESRIMGHELDSQERISPKYSESRCRPQMATIVNGVSRIRDSSFSKQHRFSPSVDYRGGCSLEIAKKSSESSESRINGNSSGSSVSGVRSTDRHSDLPTSNRRSRPRKYGPLVKVKSPMGLNDEKVSDKKIKALYTKFYESFRHLEESAKA